MATSNNSSSQGPVTRLAPDDLSDGRAKINGEPVTSPSKGFQHPWNCNCVVNGYHYRAYCNCIAGAAFNCDWCTERVAQEYDDE